MASLEDTQHAEVLVGKMVRKSHIGPGKVAMLNLHV